MSHPLQGSIVALRKAGWSYGKIAERVGCTRNVVAGVLDRCGARPQVDTVAALPQARPCRPSPFPETFRRAAVATSRQQSVQAAAEAFGVCPMSIYNWRREFAA